VSQIDDVAQAICAVTAAGRTSPWDELNEGQRDAWREMAKAAMAALGLTEQWGHSINGQDPCVNRSRDEAEQAIGYWRDVGDPTIDIHGKIWHRWSTGWVQA
jgi:hypothetical protein